MGSGFSSSRPSSAESGWGDVEEKDEDVYQPVRNYEGEVVGWRERTESDKMRRKVAKDDFEIVAEDEEDESFVEVIEETAVTEEEESDSEHIEPSSDEDQSKFKMIIDEAPDEELEDDENEQYERRPSARSINCTHVPHRARVSDKFKPSITENTHFNCHAAAAKLYKALTGSNTDEETIILIVSSHSAKQRRKIDKTYKYNHRRNLTNDLKNKLHSHFESLCVGLLQDEAEFGVESMRRVVEGSCRVNDIVGILAWKDSDTLDDINKIYKAKFRSELEDDLLSNCDSKHHPVVKICMSDNREDEDQDDRIVKDVQSLCRAIEADDKEAFKMRLNHILCCRSWDVLPDIMDMFEIVNDGNDIGYYMKKMLGKKIAEAFQPLFFILDEPSAFYAEELYECTEGPGTNDEKLMRIFIQRAEVGTST